MSLLTKFRLVNVEGIDRLHTTMGVIRLDKMTDTQALVLFMQGSRYVERLPAPAPLADTDVPQSPPPASSNPDPNAGTPPATRKSRKPKAQ